MTKEEQRKAALNVYRVAKKVAQELETLEILQDDNVKASDLLCWISIKELRRALARADAQKIREYLKKEKA